MKARKYIYTVATAGAIWLVFGALHAHSLADAQALADRWTQAFNSHDGSAMAALYRDDAELAQHNAPTLVGREHIGAFWGGKLAKGDTNTVLNVTRTLDGTDMTLLHGTYTVLDRASGLPIGSGDFAQIWRLIEGEWRIDRDIRSDAGERHTEYKL